MKKILIKQYYGALKRVYLQSLEKCNFYKQTILTHLKHLNCKKFKTRAEKLLENHAPSPTVCSSMKNIPKKKKKKKIVNTISKKKLFNLMVLLALSNLFALKTNLNL